MGRRQGRFQRSLVIVAAVTALSVPWPSLRADASTEPDLSQAVITNVLPGFVEVPPGPSNGPLTRSNVDVLGPGSSVVAQHLASGDITGYIRLWTHEPENGDDILIIALRFTNPGSIADFLATVSSAVRGSPFAVPAIPGSKGLAETTSVEGTRITAYSVDFARGDTVYLTTVGSRSGELSRDTAVEVATEQYEGAPGTVTAIASPSGRLRTWSLGAGWIVAFCVTVVVLSGLVVVLWHRRRPVRRATVGPPISATREAPAVQPAVPPAPAPVDPSVGWYPVPRSPDEQVYWNGRMYTARRQRRGAGWRDVAVNFYAGPPPRAEERVGD